jgi:hypothetical protein
MINKSSIGGKMIDNSSESEYVVLTSDGHLSVQANNIQEAKIAIKQLKIKKKEYSLAKKEIVLQQQLIKAEFTDKNRRQGAMMRGGGGIGKFVRTIQNVQRDTNKIDLANKLAPLEKQKFHIDAILSIIDQGVLKLESYLLENS